LKLACPEKYVLSIGFLFGGISAVATALSPKLIGMIFDEAVAVYKDHNHEITDYTIVSDTFSDTYDTTTYNLDYLHRFDKYIIYLAVVYCFSSITASVRGGIFTYCCSRILTRSKHRLFDAVMHKNTAFFEANTSGEIVSRMTRDITQMSDQLVVNLNVVFRTIFQMVFSIVFMVAFNVNLTISTILIVPITWKITKAYSTVLSKIIEDGNDIMSKTNSLSQEGIYNIHIVRTLNAEKQIMGDYVSYLEKYNRLTNKQSLYYAVYVCIMGFIPSMSILMVVWIGGVFIIKGVMTSGEVISFMLYQQMLTDAFNTIANVFNGVATAVASAKKVFNWIKSREDADTLFDPDNCVPICNGFGFARSDIVFDKVSFRYNGNNGNNRNHRILTDGDECNMDYTSAPSSFVLRDLNMRIHSGKMNALVGKSGCGKSSILRLILRQHKPTMGRITMNHWDIHRFDKETYFRKIGLVNQEPTLFNMSVRDNLTLGLDQMVAFETIEAAARKANAHDFIMALSDRAYDTNCGEAGGKLSGGQKQRLIIARAILRNPEMILLDEATSALDVDSEHEVQGALTELNTLQGVTMVVVAHRLSTIRGADTIQVIKDGGVESEGTHHQLLESSPTYKMLVHRQLK
jgi:ABC-type multidrug transport system fused ATPase/permease subunit